MRTKNFLIIMTMWQMVTAEENCPGIKLAGGLGSLLGNIPISSCAPDLPQLPELAYGREGYWDGLPSLPSGDFGSPSLPRLPELPGLGDCFDYPYFDQPLPYLKKKKGCGRLVQPTCPRARPSGCGFGLKIVPLIKKFPLKRKNLDCYDGLENLPCELPQLLSGVIRESINDRCY